MLKLKVAVVVGTRPELIRLSRVIARLDEFCELVLVHTGQNYDFELNEIFFDDLGIRRPDFYLDAASATPGETIGKVIHRSYELFSALRPHALLILGDTNSCLSAIAAKRQRIPIFHMEAGNRCFDFRVPEEINRKLIDHIADVNLPYSDIARECLLREGLPLDLVIKIGSPMKEVISYYSNKIANSSVLAQLALEPYTYYVLSAHREENVDDDRNFGNLIYLLTRLPGETKARIVVSLHPRTKAKFDRERVKLPRGVILSKPFKFTDYVALQRSAIAVLSDSGTISEEASILNFPALNIREAQERHEALEEGAAVLTGLNYERIIQALEIVKSQSRGCSRNLPIVRDYNVDHVSEKILRILHGHLDYVNRVVWRKY